VDQDQDQDPDHVTEPDPDPDQWIDADPDHDRWIDVAHMADPDPDHVAETDLYPDLDQDQFVDARIIWMMQDQNAVKMSLVFWMIDVVAQIVVTQKQLTFITITWKIYIIVTNMHKDIGDNLIFYFIN